MKLSEAKNMYLQNVYNRRTARQKDIDLSLLISHLSDLELGDVRPLDMFDWVEELQQNYAPRTTERRVATIKHFFNWCSSEFGIKSPANQIKLQRDNSPSFKSLTEHELCKLRAKLKPKKCAPFKEHRDYFALEFLINTGVRSGELLSLTMKQIEPNEVQNILCKGGKYRTLPVNKTLSPVLSRYVERREHHLESYDGYKQVRNKERLPLLVSTAPRTRITPGALTLDPKTLWKICRSAGVRANVGEISPHWFRHTFAKRLLEKTKDITLVSRALGHSSVETTMQYLATSKEEIREAVNLL